MEIALLLQTNSNDRQFWRRHGELYGKDHDDAMKMAAILKQSGYDTTIWLSLEEFIRANYAQGNKDVLVFPMIENCFERNRPCLVPSALELCGFPYVGSDAYAQIITADKKLFKDICETIRLACPRGIEITRQMTRTHVTSTFESAGLLFPVVLKYRYGTMSFGVCKVNDYAALFSASESLLEQEPESSLLCEEYIEGEEATVPIIGTGRQARALAMIQYTTYNKRPLELYDMSWKRNRDEEVEMHAYPDDARWVDDIKKKCLYLHTHLGLRDMSRIDLRITKDRRAYFLEANCLPNLSLNSAFDPESYDCGQSFANILLEIIVSAKARFQRGEQ